MEIRNETGGRTVKAVVFDFDGTISTLRSGWEKVMAPLMKEVQEVCPKAPNSQELDEIIRTYIDESTGIQTIYQMKWLRDQVEKFGGLPLDAWDYKAMYNTRLMENISCRIIIVLPGQKSFRYLQTHRKRSTGSFQL